MTAIDPPLPTSVEDFDKDDRISFSKLDGKYLAVHDDGSEFEFDTATRRWTVAAEEDHEAEDDIAAEAARTGNSTPSVYDASRKRKDGPSNGNDAESTASSTKRARPAKKPRAPPQPRQNTAVYVTGLPPDATIDEIQELFSRKGGVIAEEIDSGRPRIKMYSDEEGRFKGDALVVFFKPQSVEMAIMLLDDTDFRISDTGLATGRMRVQAADASYKKTKYDEEGNSSTPGGGGGSNTNSAEPSQRGNGAKSSSDRQKIIRKTQKLDAKLADWSDDDVAAIPTESTTKWQKMVVLRHMFTQAELEEDPAALLDIKEDIREECEKLGPVTNVVLYDEEPDGVVSVKFKKPESALACVQLMHGRSFDGRVVQATIATGKEKFKKSTEAVAEGHSD